VERTHATAALALAVGVAAICTLTTMASASTTATRDATSALSISVKDEGYLRFVKSSGSLLIDQGSARGTIPGTVKIRFVYDGSPSVSAQITIYARAGSLQAHATGRLSSPTSPSPSFKGSLIISAGSGRYLHAQGSGQLYGVFYRRSYGMTVQTEGTLRY
jgi:hypothetical protein